MSMVASVFPLSGSIRATVCVPPLTHTESKPTVTPHGPSGTSRVVATAFVSGPIPPTAFSPYELIQIRSSPSASSHGLGTDSILATARSSAAGPVAAEADAPGDTGTEPAAPVSGAVVGGL